MNDCNENNSSCFTLTVLTEMIMMKLCCSTLGQSILYQLDKYSFYVIMIKSRHVSFSVSHSQCQIRSAI